MKQFYKEIKPIVTLILAVITYVIVIGFGIIWNLWLSIKGTFQLKFWKGVGVFIMYWLRMLYQFWVVIKYFLNKISKGIDLLGNVGAGEMVEDVTTKRENTWFSKGSITLSQAIGQEENLGVLTSFGLSLRNALSKVFEPGHCINSYDKKLMIDRFNKDRGVRFDT